MLFSEEKRRGSVLRKKEKKRRKETHVREVVKHHSKKPREERGNPLRLSQVKEKKCFDRLERKKESGDMQK